MKIDIDSLSLDELIKLNHRVVERIKFMETMITHSEMMQFSPGDKISFEPPGRGKQIGTLVKYNKKTVTVITDAGQKWTVSPHLISKVKDIKSSNKSNVVKMPKK
jgi:hypothetical protein